MQTDMRAPRIVAVDWSGAEQGAERRIWLAEVENDVVRRLEAGRDRDAVIAELIRIAREDPNVVIGLDFAFSLPAWFLEREGLPDAPALWRYVAAHGERWLRECQSPFWGRPGKQSPPRDILPEPFRETDRAVPAVGGIRPKSVFQIGGAGAVGTGSLRGMPMLARLRDAGLAIWPFDAPRLPLVVEIYPRALTGPVTKTSEDDRRAYLHARYPELSRDIAERAVTSDDAFDALVSALVMAEQAGAFHTLPWPAGAAARVEGAIWIPERVTDDLVHVADPHAAPDVTLRDRLVSAALEWERRFGVAPAITSVISEYDAARLVGHDDDTFSADCVGRTAVTRGCDFQHEGVRYQVKANRPSGKPGSFVTLVGKATNYEWDRLIWTLYDRHYQLQEAWSWTVDAYREAFDASTRLSPADMRRGSPLFVRAAR